MEHATTRALIAGGGIGGLAAAIALRRAGIDAEVIERSATLTEVGAGISLWPNANRVLRSWGLLGEVLRRGWVVTAGELRSPQGALLHRLELPPSEEPLVLLHRAELLAILADALPRWAVRTGATVEGFDTGEREVSVDLGDAGRAGGALLVGADGLHSTIRRALLDDGEPLYRGYTVWRGVAPAGAVAWDALTETIGRGARFGTIPIGGGRVAWWAAANEARATDDGGPAERRAKLLDRFGGWHAPIPALLRATPAEEILKNDTMDRVPASRWGIGRVTLLGDAAHPTTPNLGQGGCMAIEDAAVLAEELAATPDVPTALRRYEARRRPPTARIVRESLRYGRIVQAEGSVVGRAREVALRMTPAFVSRRAMRRMGG
jgi:2-polyprenyl-6-methoxyphenol hydroxylase-like FAD-dependent oxidoreductase